MTLTIDPPTDEGLRAASTTADGCASFLEAVDGGTARAALGTGATCSFASSTSLVLALGAGATVVPGSVVTLRPGVIRRAPPLESLAMEGSVALRAPAEAVVPRVVMLAPESVGRCTETLTIDAGSSTGSGGRAFSLVRWSVTAEAPAAADVAAIQSVLEAASAAGRLSVVLPRFPLGQSAQTITFALTLRSFLGQAASSTHPVAVLTSGVVPAVRLSLASPLLLSPDAGSLIIEPDVVLPSCNSSAGAQRVSAAFLWRPFLPATTPALAATGLLPAPDASALRLTSNVTSRSALLAAAAALRPGYAYGLRVTATVTDPATGLPASASAELVFGSQVAPVAASIAGGSRKVSAAVSLVLDASGSSSPSLGPGATTGRNWGAWPPGRLAYGWAHTLAFAWSCAGADGAPCPLPQLALAAATASRVTIPASTMAGLGGTTVVVTVSVTSRLDADPSVSAQQRAPLPPAVLAASLTASSSVTMEVSSLALPSAVLRPSATLLSAAAATAGGGLATFKVSRGTRARLQAEVGGAPGTATDVVWTLVRGLSGTPADAVAGALATPASLTLPAGAAATTVDAVVDTLRLLPGVTYRLSVTASVRGGVPQQVTSSSVALLVNRPPSGGVVAVTPPSGVAAETVFRISTERWQDDPGDEPLAFAVFLDPLPGRGPVDAAALEADPRVQLLLPASPAASWEIRLPMPAGAASASGDVAAYVVVVVSDRLGAKAVAVAPVTVSTGIDASRSGDRGFASSVVSARADALLAEAEATQDGAGLFRGVLGLSSLLNSAASREAAREEEPPAAGGPAAPSPSPAPQDRAAEAAVRRRLVSRATDILDRVVVTDGTLELGASAVSDAIQASDAVDSETVDAALDFATRGLEALVAEPDEDEVGESGGGQGAGAAPPGEDRAKTVSQAAGTAVLAVLGNAAAGDASMSADGSADRVRERIESAARRISAGVTSSAVAGEEAVTLEAPAPLNAPVVASAFRDAGSVSGSSCITGGTMRVTAGKIASGAGTAPSAVSMAGALGGVARNGTGCGTEDANSTAGLDLGAAALAALGANVSSLSASLVRWAVPCHPPTGIATASAALAALNATAAASFSSPILSITVLGASGQQVRVANLTSPLVVTLPVVLPPECRGAAAAPAFFRPEAVALAAAQADETASDALPRGSAGRRALRPAWPDALPARLDAGRSDRLLAAAIGTDAAGTRLLVAAEAAALLAVLRGPGHGAPPGRGRSAQAAAPNSSTGDDGAAPDACAALTGGCVFWDDDRASWSSEGCVAVSSDGGSLTCACDHLTDFSSRLVALAAANRAVLVQAVTLTAEDLRRNPTVLLHVVGLGAAVALVLVLAAVLDCVQEVRFRDRLVADPEVGLVLSLASLEGFKDDGWQRRIFGPQCCACRAAERLIRQKASAAGKKLREATEAVWASSALVGFLLDGMPGLTTAAERRGDGARSARHPNAAASSRRLSAGSGAASSRRLSAGSGAGSGAASPLGVDIQPAKDDATARLAEPSEAGRAGCGTTPGASLVTAGGVTSGSPAVSVRPVAPPAGPSLPRRKAEAFGNDEADLARLARQEEAVREEAELLTDPFLPVCTRCVRLRRVVCGICCLRVAYTHPWAQVLTRYDHSVSRPMRLGVLVSILLAAMLSNAVMFSTRAPELALTLPEIVLFAVIGVLVQLPFTLACGTLMAWGAAGEFRRRHYPIWREIQVRAGAETALALTVSGMRTMLVRDQALSEYFASHDSRAEAMRKLEAVVDRIHQIEDLRAAAAEAAEDHGGDETADAGRAGSGAPSGGSGAGSDEADEATARAAPLSGEQPASAGRPSPRALAPPAPSSPRFPGDVAAFDARNIAALEDAKEPAAGRAEPLFAARAEPRRELRSSWKLYHAAPPPPSVPGAGQEGDGVEAAASPGAGVTAAQSTPVSGGAGWQLVPWSTPREPRRQTAASAAGRGSPEARPEAPGLFVSTGEEGPTEPEAGEGAATEPEGGAARGTDRSADVAAAPSPAEPSDRSADGDDAAALGPPDGMEQEEFDQLVRMLERADRLDSLNPRPGALIAAGNALTRGSRCHCETDATRVSISCCRPCMLGAAGRRADAEATAVLKAPLSATEVFLPQDVAEVGWAAAPAACTRRCGCLVRWLGAHPDQRNDTVRVALAVRGRPRGCCWLGRPELDEAYDIAPDDVASMAGDGAVVAGERSFEDSVREMAPAACRRRLPLGVRVACPEPVLERHGDEPGHAPVPARPAGERSPPPEASLPASSAAPGGGHAVAAPAPMQSPKLLREGSASPTSGHPAALAPQGSGATGSPAPSPRSRGAAAAPSRSAADRGLRAVRRFNGRIGLLASHPALLRAGAVADAARPNGTLADRAPEAVAWTLFAAYVAAVLWFSLAFGVVYGDVTATAWAVTFWTAQGVAVFLVQPGLILAMTLWEVVLMPPLKRAASWLPCCKPLLGALEATTVALTQGVLSGRLATVSLVQAAGVASGMSPGDAVVALGAAGSVGAAISRAMQKRARRAELAQAAESGAAESPSEEHGGSEAGTPSAALKRRSSGAALWRRVKMRRAVSRTDGSGWEESLRRAVMREYAVLRYGDLLHRVSAQPGTVDNCPEQPAGGQRVPRQVLDAIQGITGRRGASP